MALPLIRLVLIGHSAKAVLNAKMDPRLVTSIAMEVDMASLLASPIFMENCFNPLSNIDNDEDVSHIITTPPALSTVKDIPSPTRCSIIFSFHSILR